MNSQENSKSLFRYLLETSRKLELDHEQATMEADDGAAAIRIATEKYLDGYAAFNGLGTEAALASYLGTIRRYVGDIRAFMETGKYPLEINPKQWDISRCDYDVFLMLTILVTKHRCAIMEEIVKHPPEGLPLVIGVGSGVELNFIGAVDGGEAYDLYINPFARQAFPAWRFHEELYRPGSRKYGTIYAIELLEHLDDPYAFVAGCHASLPVGGKLVATTAVNVPQFDHRYNFVSDDDFERRIADLGFAVEAKRVIPHDYANMKIGARNVFYVLKRQS